MSLIGEKLGFYYRKDDWIIKDMDIVVAPGEVVGLYGYSGCGKTTLSKILSGYVTPQFGSVQVDGHSFRYGSFYPVQLIYQHPEKAINPKWRMRDIVNESYTPSQELLNAFEIREEWMNRWPIELSGGELQRFCIVRALHPEAKYLIADEMTTMLDAITQAKIWYIFLDICKHRNLGLLVISHEKCLLDRLCDRIYELR